MKYTNFPEVIDATYAPQIGDKIETTYLDGSVFTGTIAIINSRLNTCTTERGYLIWPVASAESRLLYRKPKQIRVGDWITAKQFDELPDGSICRRIGDQNTPGYDIVKVAPNDEGRRSRMRYQRIDRPFSWPRLTGLRYMVKFINN